MIAEVKNGTKPSQIQHLVDWLKNMNLDVHISEGSEVTILGLVGDTSRVDIDLLKSLEMVETVKRVSEPFKQANRKFHPKDTIIEAGNARIGGGYFAMIAGPCSVESEEQIIAVASAVKESGASILRGGAFKPRTSPYAFQGMKGEGIRLLLEAKKATGLPIVTEIMNISTLDLFADVDIIQVGARNMQNFDLLKELGKTDKPILLKRGLANTLQELLMSAEYIMSEGNSKVILCERGIRTFEHPRPFRRPRAAQSDPPACGGRSQPRHRQGRSGRPHGLRGHRRRCRRHHGGGPQRSRPRAVRRRPVHHAAPVR